MRQINTAEDSEQWLRPVTLKDWMVHCQAPPPHCQTPTAVLRYLAGYVSGAAINDSRMVRDDGTFVYFRAKNYRKKKRGIKRVRGTEFVRRFALHILPRGMRRMRSAG